MSNSYYTDYQDLDSKLSRLYDLQVLYEKQGWDTSQIIGKQGLLIRKGEERKSINNQGRRST